MKEFSENGVGRNFCIYGIELLQRKLVAAIVSLEKNSRNIKQLFIFDLYENTSLNEIFCHLYFSKIFVSSYDNIIGMININFKSMLWRVIFKFRVILVSDGNTTEFPV